MQPNLTDWAERISDLCSRVEAVNGRLEDIETELGKLYEEISDAESSSQTTEE